MTVLTRRARIVGTSGALAVFAVLAGCSQSEVGTPTSAAGGTSANNTPSSGPKTTSSRSTPGGTKIEACSLLPDASAKGFGLATPGTAKTLAGIPGCSWTASGQFILTIAIDNKGIAGLNGQSISLPKHKAVQVANAGASGGCGVSVETSDAASAAIIGIVPTSGSAPEQACPRAVEVAKVVDSTLP